jgi:hypothetical protein
MAAQRVLERGLADCPLGKKSPALAAQGTATAKNKPRLERIMRQALSATVNQASPLN